MQDNFLVTTIALLGLSVYMGVAFKDIAVIKMIKGRVMGLPTISSSVWHQSVGATLGVSIMQLQLYLEMLFAFESALERQAASVYIAGPGSYSRPSSSCS